GVEGDRLETGQAARVNVDALVACQRVEVRGEFGLGVLQQVLVGVAQVAGEHGARGDDVDQVRHEIDAADGGHLVAAHLAGQLAREGGDGARRVAGVVAHAHGRGAGVVGLPGDGDLLPGDALQVLAHADGDAL